MELPYGIYMWHKVGRHTEEELLMYILESTVKIVVWRKAAFIKTKSVANAKNQLEITSEEEVVLAEIEESVLLESPRGKIGKIESV